LHVDTLMIPENVMRETMEARVRAGCDVVL
jgi:hypothetical protein